MRALSEVSRSAHTYFFVLGSLAIVVTFLVVARDFLVPLVIAVLVWSLLNGIIEQFIRISIGPVHIPRWLATIVAIGLVLLACALIAKILSDQVDAIAEAGPRYVARLESLFGQLVATIGAETAAQAEQALSQLDIASVVSKVVGSAGATVLDFVLVTIYVAFLLVEERYIRPKFAALFPDQADAAEVRQLLVSIVDSLRSYILIKTVMSILTGGTSYIVLTLVGVDFAETWALIIFLLYYIPNIGSALGVVLPALLALVQFDTLTPFLIVTGGLALLQFIIGNVIEPALTGRSLNLSSFAVILSLSLWGAIWGIVGMFLSVPIAVIVMIVCSNVPAWRWIAIALSTDGRLTKGDVSS